MHNSKYEFGDFGSRVPARKSAFCSFDSGCAVCAESTSIWFDATINSAELGEVGVLRLFDRGEEIELPFEGRFLPRGMQFENKGKQQQFGHVFTFRTQQPQRPRRTCS